MKLSDYLPAKARKAIYSLIGLAVGLEAIWDIVPDFWEGRILQTLTVLGFGLALSQTNDAS